MSHEVHVPEITPELFKKLQDGLISTFNIAVTRAQGSSEQRGEYAIAVGTCAKSIMELQAYKPKGMK